MQLRRRSNFLQIKRTPECQERREAIRPLLIAHTQSAKLVEPSKGSFHDPVPSAQPTAMFSISLGEPQHDVTGTQTSADSIAVITPVAYHTIRTMARRHQ
jgi:hypothetical protein